MADPAVVGTSPHSTSDGARDTYSSTPSGVPLIAYDIANRIDCIDMELTPLTRVMRSLPKAPCHDTTIRWKEDEKVPEQDTVNGSVGATGTTLVVDNGARWSAYDLGCNTQTLDVFRVLSRSTNTLTIQWITASPSIVYDGAVLLRIGNAYPQFDVYQAPKSTIPVERTNYVQDTRHPQAASDLAIDAKYFFDPADWPYQIKKKGVEHQQALELSTLFGDDAFDVTTNDHPMGTAKGCYQFITTNVTDFAAVATTRATLNDFFEGVMENGTKESNHNYWFFTSHRIHSQICQFGSDIERTRAGQTELGMRITVFHTSIGPVRIKALPILTGVFDGMGFFLDMVPHRFKWRYWRGKDTRLRKLMLADGRTGEVWEWRTVHSLELHHEYNMGIITGVGA